MIHLKTVNELTLSAECDGSGILFTKTGAMIGFYGDCKFDKVVLGPTGSPMQALLGQLGRRLTGENIPLMKVISNGPTEGYFACQAKHVTVVELQVGQELMVESEDLLAFTDAVDYGLKAIGCGIISQKGLFTTKLTGKGAGAQAAFMTNGNPIIMDTPCCVDPDAMVAFTGPEPQFKSDVSWKTFLGQSSGESYMLDYRTPGFKVVIQPYERHSGIDVGIDNHGAGAYVQRNTLFR
ncbi:MAG: AIM24 family protein [Oscillospiraceae bacterium]|nr:AIM24 family protein [Oscillospiraceae bacterium]